MVTTVLTTVAVLCALGAIILSGMNLYWLRRMKKARRNYMALNETPTTKGAKMATQTESHPCEYPGCEANVAFDDEPYCFKHSDDSGSFVFGYSYKKSHE